MMMPQRHFGGKHCSITPAFHGISCFGPPGS
jgi:hypothetical protein